MSFELKQEKPKAGILLLAARLRSVIAEWAGRRCRDYGAVARHIVHNTASRPPRSSDHEWLIERARCRTARHVNFQQRTLVHTLASPKDVTPAYLETTCAMYQYRHDFFTYS
jgi:hypothetical protein